MHNSARANAKAYKQTMLITLIAHLIFTKMQCDALAQSLVITIKRKRITRIILCIINYVLLIRLYEMVNSLMRSD